MPPNSAADDTKDRPGEPKPDSGTRPEVPPVEQPDPRSPQFKREVREEIEKEKLDP